MQSGHFMAYMLRQVQSGCMIGVTSPLHSLIIDRSRERN
jgi:hypothetical protein